MFSLGILSEVAIWENMSQPKKIPTVLVPRSTLLAAAMPSAKVDANILMRKHSVAFTRIDANDDQLIDYNEFLDAMPPHVREMRSPWEIKRWFDMLDKNKTGCVSIDEVFA